MTELNNMFEGLLKETESQAILLDRKVDLIVTRTEKNQTSTKEAEINQKNQLTDLRKRMNTITQDLKYVRDCLTESVSELRQSSLAVEVTQMQRKAEKMNLHAIPYKSFIEMAKSEIDKKFDLK